ncbi:hypothetical protein PASE110613_01800 [Paenibacillus sediminis]|uniref:Ni2+-binding GTPase n=1 Tax=Paenibacillus sediminis TaxID=664909 RepID=A0ABS4GZK9_9BACL|nr:hypothetical protein [Paenibacillus sediminis]MBP1935681.1 hypothetical protein [Paenibacillus sediminis]
MHNERIEEYKRKKTALFESGNVDQSARELIIELIEQLEQLAGENHRLRKAVLKATSSHQSKMSTKLRDALYE